MTFEREDVTAILRGVFEINVKLAAIARDVRAIHELLDGDDEEEEA